MKAEDYESYVGAGKRKMAGVRTLVALRDKKGIAGSGTRLSPSSIFGLQVVNGVVHPLCVDYS